MADQSSQIQSSINATNVPHHTHNGLDSPQISNNSVAGATRLGVSGQSFLSGNIQLIPAGIISLTQSSSNNSITISAFEIGFGGTGVDGALSISSGTTTINCSGAAVVVKNYTSISITGTGKLAFSNPNAHGTIIVLRSQGNITLTSSATPMLDCSSLGGAGGLGGVVGSPPTGGGNGTGVIQPYIWANDSCFGTGGTTSAGAGATGSIYSLPYLYITDTNTPIWRKFGFTVTPGSGAGGGAAGGQAAGGTGANGGAGGRGGGGLYIECGGSWNFTTSNGISVAGGNGVNGTSATASGVGTNNGGAGGGGGQAGWCVALYNSLVSNSGTVNNSGGNGGNGGNAFAYVNSVGAQAGGGGGGSGFVSGGAGGGLGASGVNGSNSVTTGSGGGIGGTPGSTGGTNPLFSNPGSGGGGGGGGEVIITQNIYF